ncbi:hypothetical protein BT96DRAFT_227429 [Gymnopus androsaceus JB14]|uniref:Uncharacterized protein n=1 Tax=Gymnopus androsaceus JB14 TaxID=1447944 RepID=A0A6A4H7L8_9AGAR|nr:hypothetical protein BT96DRAFT_227429 [Gymnopus androsaceus JB14]
MWVSSALFICHHPHGTAGISQHRPSTGVTLPFPKDRVRLLVPLPPGITYFRSDSMELDGIGVRERNGMGNMGGNDMDVLAWCAGSVNVLFGSSGGS